MEQKLKVIVVHWSWLCQDMMQGIEAQGHEVIAVPREGVQLPQRIISACAAHKPDCLFSVNFNPLLAEISHNKKIPYLAWNVDNLIRSDFCDPRFAFPTVLLFLIDKPAMRIYQQKGYPHLFYMPIASNLDRFKPAADVNKKFAVSFVGCSMVQEGNEYPRMMANLVAKADADPSEQGRKMYLLVKQVLEQIVETECQDNFQSTIQERLAEATRQYGFDIARILWPDPAFFYIILAKEISSRKRMQLISALARHHAVDVFGDEDWSRLDNDRVTCHSRVDYQLETAQIYQQSRINVNIEKVYNTSSLNLRILDAMACGSFVLTEPVDDLKDFFEDGVELVTFGSEEELMQRAAYYLAHPEERETIAERGQKKVVQQFSLVQRITEMLDAFQVWRQSSVEELV